MLVETPDFNADDVIMLDDFEPEDVVRLLWNLEVLQEQVGAKLIIVGGTESSETSEYPGVALRAPGHTARQLHAKVNALQQEGRMDRGALYLFEDRVYVDARGRMLRGFGDDEGKHLDASDVKLMPGLSIKTLFPDESLVLRDMSYSESPPETPSSTDIAERAEAPLSPRTKKAIMVGVGVAIAGAVLTGGYFAWRKIRPRSRRTLQP